MIKVKNKPVRSSAYHTKSFTIETNAIIPYEFVCEHCGTITKNNYIIRKHRNYSVIKPKTGENDDEIVYLELPEDIKEKTYEKFEKDINQQIKLLKDNADKNNFNMINDSLCAECRCSQSWKAKYDYYFNLTVSAIVSFLIILAGFLVGLIFKNILHNLSFSIEISLFNYFFRNGALFGTIIGFVFGAIYFLVKANKYQKQRYDLENVEKKEFPVIKFDEIKIEKKTFELQKEDRMK